MKYPNWFPTYERFQDHYAYRKGYFPSNEDFERYIYRIRKRDFNVFLNKSHKMNREFLNEFYKIQISKIKTLLFAFKLCPYLITYIIF